MKQRGNIVTRCSANVVAKGEEGRNSCDGVVYPAHNRREPGTRREGDEVGQWKL